MNQEKEEVNYPSLIILGTQRSGTTLLTRILSTHSDLFLQNEISVESVFGSNKLEDILRNINNQVQNRHGRTINQLLVDMQKSKWGLKDPELTYHLDSLKLLSNKSKFLHLVRDGRAVVNSYMNNKWGLGTTAYTGALRWNKEVNLIENFLNENACDYLTIKFEDLVSQPEVTLKNICHFTGLQYEKSLLDFHMKKANYKINASNKNTNSTLSPMLLEQWQRAFSTKQIESIEFVGKSTLKRFGYKLITSGCRPSFISRAASFLHQKIIGELQIQYQLKRISLKKKFRNNKIKSQNYKL